MVVLVMLVGNKSCLNELGQTLANSCRSSTIYYSTAPVDVVVVQGNDQQKLFMIIKW